MQLESKAVAVPPLLVNRRPDCYSVAVALPSLITPAAAPPAAPRNLLLRLAYDGTDYSGWQIQPDRPTIQGILAGTIARIIGETVQVHGAGRTDAGVHAAGQTASVVLQAPIPCANLVTALNDHLPESIRVLSVQEVPLEFHARRSARSKIYQYRIFRGSPCPPMTARYVYPFPYPLNEDAMSNAARIFEGTQDFRSFASLDAVARAAEPGEEKSAVRTIFSSVLQRDGDELVYSVEGSGFLHHMVRNIVGTLIEVGRGNLPPESVTAILAARDRSAAGATAPARGLHLLCVRYAEADLRMPLPSLPRRAASRIE